MRSVQRLVGFVVLGICFAVASGVASAQDPVAVNAKTTRVKLENDRVRVLEATLPPGAKEQVHSHPAHIIYVLAGGRVRNYAADGTWTDAVLKEGDVVYREPLTHAAENIGDTPLHLILVEFKKQD